MTSSDPREAVVQAARAYVDSYDGETGLDRAAQFPLYERFRTTLAALDAVPRDQPREIVRKRNAMVVETGEPVREPQESPMADEREPQSVEATRAAIGMANAHWMDCDNRDPDSEQMMYGHAPATDEEHKEAARLSESSFYAAIRAFEAAVRDDAAPSREEIDDEWSVYFRLMESSLIIEFGADLDLVKRIGRVFKKVDALRVSTVSEGRADAAPVEDTHKHFPPVEAGEWIRPPLNEPYLMECCDCGLKHAVRFAIDEDGRILMAAWRLDDAEGANDPLPEGLHARADAPPVTTVDDRTLWLMRHLCDALGWDVPTSTDHHIWDRAVAEVRRLTSAHRPPPPAAPVPPVATEGEVTQ